ncbi:MAG: PhoPQ-activated protein PqaA family protein, partial [Armatimonadota bacterium]
LLEGGEFVLGDLSRPAVTAVPDGLWVAWQADNIRYTGLFARLEDFLPVVSRIRVAKLKPAGQEGAAGEAVLEPASPGVRTDLSAIKSECMRGHPRIQRRVAQCGGKKYYVITGNLHEHTNTPSSCMVPSADEGTHFDNYRYALDVHGYDFAALTDHDFGLYYDAAWRKAVRAADFFDDPPHFCAIPAYEFSFINTTWGKQFQPARGSQILYFGSHDSAMRFTRPDGRVCCQLDEETNDLNKLLAELRKRGIKDAVLPPHQLTDFYSVTDWDIKDPEYRTVMEIFQVRGSYEYEGCPRQVNVHFIPNTHEKADGCDRAWAQNALARGQRLGFIAAGDHKSTGVGTTVLFVREVSRKGIIEAMKARRCYATTGEKIFLDFRIDGHLMGEEITCAGKPRITAVIEGTAPLTSVVVFKNNRIIYEKKGDDLCSLRSCKLDFADEDYSASSFYYLRVVQENDEIAWASPIWVDSVPELSSRGLWDLEETDKPPFDAEVVCSRAEDGYKAEGTYITSLVTPNGPNRTYVAVAQPETIREPVPVFINLTGGSDNLDAVLWLARRLGCAVVDIEWRNPNAEHRSKWARPTDLDVWHIGVNPADNIGYALLTGARRAIDFVSTQPGIDASRIACGSGSMGGYYSLLLAGVDDRVKCVFDTYGAGNLADSGGRIAWGLKELPAESRRAWLSAFDPIRYAGHTRASTLFYLAANDFFFWLGDGLANYKALPGEKRLLVVPNYNHNLGAFGEPVPECGWEWVRYCLHGGPSFPTVTAPRARGNVYTWSATGPVPVIRSVLYWSPGNVSWPSRYWRPILATRKADRWTAAIPEEFAPLAAQIYVTAFDEAGRASSSTLVERKGADPCKSGGRFWPGGCFWDTQRGPAAWRPTGPAASPGPAPESVESEGPGGLRIVPAKNERRFSLLTNSVVLAAGLASRYRGIRLVVNGCGRGGVLVVSLQRGSGSVQELSYSATVKYSATRTIIRVPWT